MRAQAKIIRRVFFASTFVVLGIALSGCGKQGYDVVASQQNQAAPGGVAIPPKVDVLLVQDNTGSMIGPYAQVSSQIPTFLAALQESNWDWHFSSAPLTTVQQMRQAMASYYDGNWGSQWQSPYPGAQISNADNLSASIFTQPANFSWAVTPGNEANGSEPGFKSIFSNLTTSVQGTGFIRPDALLVVLVMGNGNDTSGVNMCYRSDAQEIGGQWQGVVLPCDDPEIGMPLCTEPFPQSYNSNIIAPPYTAACGNTEESYQYYKASLLGLKQSIGSYQSNFQFYADVSQNGGSCLGGNSYVGARYLRMSNEVSGTSFDICSQQLGAVLATVGDNLTATMLNFVTGYLFMAQQPNISTIQVTKYPGGDTSNAVNITQDGTNGWTYIGYQSNIDAIISPVPMNLSSGYALQLNGSAQLVGADTATVTYTPAGLTDSSHHQLTFKIGPVRK